MASPIVQPEGSHSLAPFEGRKKSQQRWLQYSFEASLRCWLTTVLYGPFLVLVRIFFRGNVCGNCFPSAAVATPCSACALGFSLDFWQCLVRLLMCVCTCSWICIGNSLLLFFFIASILEQKKKARKLKLFCCQWFRYSSRICLCPY